MRKEHIDRVILRLITNNDVHEQVQLQKMLKDNGYDVTQATISRKLKKLNILKIGSTYRPDNDKSSQAPKVKRVKVVNPNLIILHTDPGLASAVAFQIDQNCVHNQFLEGPLKSVVGTIAGDDTILLIVDAPDRLNTIAKLLEEKFG
jgi:transcriptional regulator of arginine metabolism